MANHPLKEWRSIIVAVFILGIIAGANFWGNVSAQDGAGGPGAGGDGPGRSAEARRIVPPPQNTTDRAVIQVEGGAVDVTAGVSIGENVPGASPGTPSQPVPNFSAINTPVWVSSQGPAQIVDDLVIYGLTEVKGGLINNGGVAPPPGGGGGGAPPAPTSELTIAPASGQPTGRNILQSAVWDLPIASIQLSSTGADVTVNTIKITFDGTASPTNFNALKLYDGANLLGDTITTFINNKATVTGFTLTIPASGPSKTLTLHAFMGGTAAAANSTFRFGIIDPLDITSSDDDPVGTAMGNFFTVTAPPPSQPDLVVDTPITILPETIQAGNSATFNATVRNRGSIRANASTTHIRIDGNPLGGNFGGDDAATGALNVNATETERWIWTATQGNHTVQVCADIAAAVAEGNEGNNCTSQTFAVVAAPPPPPALDIAIAPDTPDAGNVQQGSVDFITTKFTLAASGADVTVTSIAVTRTGTASDSNLSNLKLYNMSEQIGTTQSLNTSTHKATFSGLNLSIQIGTPQTLTVRTTVVSGQGSSFALSVSAGADVTATSSGNPVAPTGLAPGNSFTIAAPAQTLTFTRVNVPVAGSQLPAGGSDVTLLEFNAQMNTGTVNLRQLFVVPKTGKSGRITNLKLWSGSSVLDSAADSATLRGKDAYSFGYGSASASNLLSIGTTITRLRVTGDVGCGNGAIEDHILEAAGDVIIREAGINIQTLPFATVSRTLTACPIPAPTVSYKCSSGKLYADIGWSTLGKGDNTAPAAGFYVDFDNEAVAANAFRTGAGQNGFWNTSSNYTSAATFSLAENAKVAPYSLGGYNPGGTEQNSLTNLIFSAPYQTRIYYPKTSEHSSINTFTTPASCSGYPTFSLTGFRAPTVPPRGGGTVEFSFPSVLHGDGESSTGEQANAGWFADTANAQALPSPPATLHPVYIFDDLYVYGNGATGPEPGNLFVRGGIVTEGNSNIGSVGSITQFTGNVSIVGGTLSVGTLAVSGNLNVSGNITASGNIRADSIGIYSTLTSAANRPSLSGTTAWPARATSSVSCPAGDTVISCSGFYNPGPAPGIIIELDSKIDGSRCEVRSRMSRASAVKVAAQAVCFSPN